MLGLLDRLTREKLASRIWGRETTAFLAADSPGERQAAVRDRLGWLDSPQLGEQHHDGLTGFARHAAQDRLTDVVLLGMGGSSLCAEVLRDAGAALRDPGAEPHRARSFVVLDTTDERTVRGVTERLQPARTLFLVASKSGSTIEVASLERHFWSVMKTLVPDDPGRHFVAITDPETPLVTLAGTRGYRQTFVNPPDIGGRYSALSLFGLVPAALLGLDLLALTRSAAQMAETCQSDWDNPSLALGAFMAAHAMNGRDKLTLLLSPELEALGPWIEQLVAESTGKDGTGVLPVVGEPTGAAHEYGSDRAFVAVLTSGLPLMRGLCDTLEAGGHPVFIVDTSREALGAEFFRWMFATAVAGAALGVNPFDEPNVREAKARTAEQLAIYEQQQAFTLAPPFEEGSGYSRREHHREAPDPKTRGRYVAILDYLPPDVRRADFIARLRAALRRRAGVATTYGIGPRYLHSTGQFHKGGPNTGTFLLFTGADATSTAIPGTSYSFSVLKQAQALGDFAALAAADRKVVQYHFDDPASDPTQALERVLQSFR
jgi:glucose-6-phosphate isomerase